MTYSSYHNKMRGFMSRPKLKHDTCLNPSRQVHLIDNIEHIKRKIKRNITIFDS